MTEIVEAANLDQISPGTGATVNVADKEIAIFNVDGEIDAIGDSCPHAGAFPGAGKLNGRNVTRRTHGLRYDITTGSHNRRLRSCVLPNDGGERKDSDPARLKNRGYSAGAHRGQQTDHGEHQYGDLKR
ncbi:MAG: Rieske 2Fe-2S domain-containing protein [Acidobacteriaceae bacterium]|nr:Rieske 2Fe-2S domain-containing protein [Acidobacteriaceae bacterium]